MRQCHTVFRARARETDDVLGTDVRSKDGCADDPPAEIAAGEEVIRGGILVLADHPPGNAQQKTEIECKHDPIDSLESGMIGVYNSEYWSDDVHWFSLFRRCAEVNGRLGYDNKAENL